MLRIITKTAILCLFLILISQICFAHNDSISVKIIESDPSSGKTLNKNEALYLHISYESNIPLRFQAKAFYHGEDQKAAMNPAPAYAPGKGEAIAWVFFSEPNQIDEIKLDIFNSKWKKIKTIPFKININWRGAFAKNKRSAAVWTQKLKTEQQNMVDYGQNAQSDGGFWTDLILMFIGLIVPGYFAMQIYMGIKYKNGWRKAAFVPLIIMIPIIIFSVYALFQGSNLWPLYLIFIAPFGFVYLSGLGIFKFIKERV